MNVDTNRSFEPTPPQVAATIKGGGDKRLRLLKRSNVPELISNVEIAGLVILLSLAVLVILPG